MSAESLVSVVTPFYNTASYLAECIESVLAQTYGNFEYVLLDNCSTDGSDTIAKDYAARDPRLRYVTADTFVGQVLNYNRALREISPHSKYCKIIQADDWMFPSCLSEMVRLADANPSVGIVGAYTHNGHEVAHVGLPFSRTGVFWGPDAIKRYLLLDYGFLGSPTCVMFRSDLVRARDPFYALNHPCEDVAACLELLHHCDLGFVHQVLTFNRRDNESIWTRIDKFSPIALHNLVLLYRHGPAVLDERAYTVRRGEVEGAYYALLARASLHRWDKDFWDFHEDSLKSQGLSIDRRRLACEISLLRMTGAADHPKMSLRRVVRWMRKGSRLPSGYFASR